jgi:ppGpp synthetase/RelA/SpoT-type nucleotidyltranferase
LTPIERFSGSQLEKLGDRLRVGPLSLSDLQQLRRYLDTLEPFAEETFARVRELSSKTAGLRAGQIARRNVKTVRSIVAKLRRQTTTLPQIQDLVGCRVVVPDIIDQSLWLERLKSAFPDSRIIDRRLEPRYGYRAVHIVVRDGNKRFEVQLRTLLQDRWLTSLKKLTIDLA